MRFRGQPKVILKLAERFADNIEVAEAGIVTTVAVIGKESSFFMATPQHMECNLGVRYTTSYTVVVRIATSIVDVGVHSDKAKSSGLGS